MKIKRVSLLNIALVTLLAFMVAVSVTTAVQSQAKESESCISCHGKVKDQFQFKRSAHSLNDIECVDCHETHDKKTTDSNKASLKMKEPQLCYSCHEDVKLNFSQKHTHDLESGDMTCTSCHTPHGGPGGDANKTLKKHSSVAARANDVSNETCVKCHDEKEGPFVNQHSSVVAEEGCDSCHTPHGSQNRFMLKHQRSDMLCRECHGTMPSFHYADADTLNSEAKIVESGDRENCTSCHGTIHGSNQDFMMMDE